VNAFGNVSDTLRVSANDRLLALFPITFSALEPVERVVDLEGETAFRVELPLLGLDYTLDPTARKLARPFATDPAARERIPRADQLAFEARELARGRRYHEAREMFAMARAEEPWHREALLGLADLEYRRGLYEAGLAHVTRVLQLDAYDASANFIAGNLHRALGREPDAHEAYGWAARSMASRSAAYVQLAELALAAGDYQEASRYGWLALDYDRYNAVARQVLAMIGRKRRDATLASTMRQQLIELDPLSHFIAAEAYLAAPSAATATSVTAVLRGEYPEQAILELAVDYVRRGATDDALTLLRLGTEDTANTLLQVWLAWLADDPTQLPQNANLAFVFPYRRETIAVLEWAVQHNEHWSWSYLLALNLWARDRADEAVSLLEALAEAPDFAPLYVSRAHLLQQVRQRDPETDLRRAVQLDETNRTIRIHLIRYLQNQERWQDASTESAVGRTLFPDDFNLQLLHAQSLNQLGRAREAIDILSTTHVLPSENSRESHRLYEQAHTLVALDAMEIGAYDEARRHLNAALEWPEHLGQGRPYDPEERLTRYLLGLVTQKLGQQAEARDAFEAVIDATGQTGASADRLDLLAIPSLAALGRQDAIRVIWQDAETDIGRLGGEMIGAVESGDFMSEAMTRLATDYSELFDDLLGRMLLKTLGAR
jgi:predicted Zn-dependent protease